MKRIAVLLLLISISACKSKVAAVKSEPIVETKLNRSAQVAIKGNWIIKNVSYAGSDYFAVKSFQIADSKCFVGSTWNFISNNNKGSMSLTNSDCVSMSSPIVWSINKEGFFVLKFVQEGNKAKTVSQGFLLRVANQTETSFELIDTINIAGKNKEVVYQFEKK